MQNDDKIDLLLAEFNLAENKRKREKCLAYWVSEEEHALYRQIQDATRKDFGKWVENTLSKMIRRKYEKLFPKAS